MIRKKARRLLFVEAAIFILIVYILVISITLILDEIRINELDAQIKKQGIKHEAFLASNIFYEAMGKTNCEFSHKYIFDEYDDIKELSINIASYKNRILTRNEKYHDLKKREYIIAQVENLNKINKHNDVCEKKIRPIFYFIDGDIIGFNQQALILQQFGMNHQEEIIIYTLDINYDDEPIIKALLELYNVTNHNTIIFGELNNVAGGQIGIGALTQELNRQRGT